MARAAKRHVNILDCRIVDSRCELLNGHGEPLSDDAPTEVYLRFEIGDCGKARNSAGELFYPNVISEMFDGQQTTTTMQRVR